MLVLKENKSSTDHTKHWMAEYELLKQTYTDSGNKDPSFAAMLHQVNARRQINGEPQLRV